MSPISVLLITIPYFMVMCPISMSLGHEPHIRYYIIDHHSLFHGPCLWVMSPISVLLITIPYFMVMCPFTVLMAKVHIFVVKVTSHIYNDHELHICVTITLSIVDFMISSPIPYTRSRGLNPCSWSRAMHTYLCETWPRDCLYRCSVYL